MTALAKAETGLPICYEDVVAARAAIGSNVIRTPCLRSQTLSELTNADVWLKFENLQFTAAYKERGALNKLMSLNAEQRARGVIAASAGNHAQGLTYCSRRIFTGIHNSFFRWRFHSLTSRNRCLAEGGASYDGLQRSAWGGVELVDGQVGGYGQGLIIYIST